MRLQGKAALVTGSSRGIEIDVTGATCFVGGGLTWNDEEQ